MSRLLQDVAYSLGVQASKNGKMCIPAYDKALAENCLKGCQIGEGIPYLKAWINGWNDASLGKHDDAE